MTTTTTPSAAMTPENWLTGIGEGWHALVRPLIKQANREGITIFQVKEKFGGLRFYVENYAPSSELYAAIQAAEDASIKTCEICGAPGKPRGGGWIKTWCDKHAEERRPQRQDKP